MIQIIIPNRIARQITRALIAAGPFKTGGIMLGEHTGHDCFRISEITVQEEYGSENSFTRRVEEIRDKSYAVFRRNGMNCSRFNYLGEWHSHPASNLEPGLRDELTMMEIVGDRLVGANFAVLMIVKMSDRHLAAAARAYTAAGKRYEASLLLEQLAREDIY